MPFVTKVSAIVVVLLRVSCTVETIRQEMRKAHTSGEMEPKLLRKVTKENLVSRGVFATRLRIVCNLRLQQTETFNIPLSIERCRLLWLEK